MKTTTAPVHMTKRSYFRFDGAVWCAIEVSSGDVELYREEEGIEMFKGYVTALNIPGALKCLAIQALYHPAARPEFSPTLQLEMAL